MLGSVCCIKYGAEEPSFLPYIDAFAYASGARNLELLDTYVYLFHT